MEHDSDEAAANGEAFEVLSLSLSLSLSSCALAV
jgi:hypothetical protein